MIRSLWTAATGMNAQQQNIDVISNNLANVNTTGFKKSRVQFQDLMYQIIREAGAPTTQGTQLPAGIEVGNGVRTTATQKILSQGSFQSTGNALDVLVEGEGFFQILRPDGTISYTRDGSFKRDNLGRVVTSDGFYVYPEIYIPEDAMSVAIAADGTIAVLLAGDDLPQEVGQFELARFINPAGLTRDGRNLFSTTLASGDPIIGNPGTMGLGTLVQGYLEMSNVEIVDEMVGMIAAQRAYELNSKAIQASDEMLNTANQLRR